MDYKKILEEKLKQSGGILLSEEVISENIPSIYLTRMVEQGRLQRVNRGIYMMEGGQYDEYYFFQRRYKVAIFSYLSALYLHQLMDSIPNKLEVTLYRGYNPHRMDENIIKHYVTKEVHELGTVDCKTMYGNTVRVYDLERTICDLIRNRKAIDSEIFSKVLNRYASSSNKDLSKLYKYAQKMKILDKVLGLVEVLYE
ncbi:type IV toxin-antitoxin system AbiEi family antitoxin domain-containing protein [Veillonella sp. CHU740]|uniref:type IV toxin-antitoxin system AbiEi family antitoxin domain-containing protein n=1 Tax=Veillonella sp. CHU740 TaxID=2490950 RepID=UPI000F8D0AB7|nr:type IV toxin-antitoxin system AbiEi family antitoxin domain-containing protein [Veillonella sp. CHU740]